MRARARAQRTLHFAHFHFIPALGAFYFSCLFPVSQHSERTELNAVVLPPFLRFFVSAVISRASLSASVSLIRKIKAGRKVLESIQGLPACQRDVRSRLKETYTTNSLYPVANSTFCVRDDGIIGSHATWMR